MLISYYYGYIAYMFAALLQFSKAKEIYEIVLLSVVFFLEVRSERNIQRNSCYPSVYLYVTVRDNYETSINKIMYCR
jgi:hypothetical protein